MILNINGIDTNYHWCWGGNQILGWLGKIIFYIYKKKCNVILLFSLLNISQIWRTSWEIHRSDACVQGQKWLQSFEWKTYRYGRNILGLMLSRFRGLCWGSGKENVIYRWRYESCQYSC